MKRNTTERKESIKSTENKLINKDGSINVTSFHTNSGKWHVVGTESRGRECIDECYNPNTGERIHRTRAELKTLEEQGHIFDVGK